MKTDLLLLSSAIVALVAAITVLWIGIGIRKNALLLAILIPTLIGSSLVPYFVIRHLSGYAVHENIPVGSYYLGHKVGPNREWIYVWSMNSRELEKGPRNCKIPYTKTREFTMEQMKNSKGRCGLAYRKGGFDQDGAEGEGECKEGLNASSPGMLEEALGKESGGRRGDFQDDEFRPYDFQEYSRIAKDDVAH